MTHLPVINFPVAKANHNKGFTLMEVLIVIFIVGILAAVSSPSLLGWYRRTQLNKAVTEVRGVLQTAQREAMRRSESCSVNFNTSSTPVTVQSCFSNVTLPNSLTMSLSNGSTIQFGFRGNTNNNNTIRFASQVVNEEKCLVISMPLGIIREGLYNNNATPKCQKR